MVRGAADQSVVDDGVDKERKKKNRRSNRRSNRVPSVSASGSAATLISEMHEEAKQTLRNGNKKSFVSHLSSRQQGLDLHPSNTEESTSTSAVAFCSLPAMLINKLDSVETSSMHHLLPADFGGKVVSKSCPKPSTHGGREYINEERYAQTPIFFPHLSRQAVNEALEKGYALKALFHANAHSQLEAYCKIEGVQADVLISGVAAQNRAVEGDVVLLKVDPLSLWTKMKGLSNNSVLAEYSNFLSEANEKHGDTYKGNNKIDLGYDCVNSNCTILSEKEFHYEDVFAPGETSYLESMEPACCNYINRYHIATSDSTYIGSSSQQCDVLDAVERLSATISLNPLKQPTGRILAIIESSPHRDCIVGYLNVNQWFSYRDRYKKDIKKKCLRVSEHEYIQLSPIDPRFPEMMVLVKDLPDCIKKRLDEGDTTLEMDLVAAQILCWGEESPFPQAHISRVFGRDGEVEPHINAILYENAVCSEFSQESLSCLPSVPWEVPTEEFNSRKDLRNLCIFTIGPSTATDLNDALSIESLSDGIFRVGVHVADVSYFVLPDTALDIEAQLRSTSVYMYQYKIPMLPFLLSENLGSLNPGVDRLAFSIFWELNGSGNVIDRWIGRTVIRSCCKLSYENAQNIINGKIDVESFKTSGNGFPQLYGNFEWADVIRSIWSLHEVSKTLKEKRFSEGASQLESSKPVLLLNEDGTSYDSMLSERMESIFLVTEFMLLANRTAAEVICRAFPEGALLLRHPAPSLQKLKEFEAFCQKHGLELDTSSSRQFHQSLERVMEKLKDDTVLYNILMNYSARPMQLASYFCSVDFKDNVDWSHYGLGVPLYTRFTSPLHRYPDIVVHRTLAAALEVEELLGDYKRKFFKEKQSDEMKGRFLSGICYEKDALESMEGREALSVAALRHGVPCKSVLAGVAAHCNGRKLVSRNVKDACEQLYMWVLLSKKEVLLSEAKVLGVGPRFMSIYIHKLAIERVIYYDEVEGLKVEWLEATSTLVLNLSTYKRSCRRGGLANYRRLEDVALVKRPFDLKEEQSICGGSANECIATNVGVADLTRPYLDPNSNCGIDPAVFPMTVHLLSTIPVALHAVGGDDGPLDIGVRLYMSTYLW